MSRRIDLKELNRFIAERGDNDVFILSDSGAAPCVLPVLFESAPGLSGVRQIIVAPGDDYKSLETASEIWKQLIDGGATRKSLLINIGGGMITDLGGFAAALFKRGMRCVNIPTTLLAMADASTGGKTGVNFVGLKNEIGVFSEPECVVIEPRFLKTLPYSEYLSGYAEMIKTGLIGDKTLYTALLDADNVTGYRGELDSLIMRCIAFKEEVTSLDPHEKGLRKILNYGHTAGHAFESLQMKRNSPVAHGIAVAWGLVTETILSHLLSGFDSMNLYPLASFIKEHYPAFPFRCKDYEELIALMQHDKKNHHTSEINFTLLRQIGEPETDCIVSADEIRSALDITLDLLV